MKDIYHIPVMVDEGFICSVCGATLPSEPCIASVAMGCAVVQLGSNFVPVEDFDRRRMIKCDSPAAKAELERSKAMESELALNPDQSEVGPLVKMPKLSKAEKIVNRQGFANFFAMREATRPKD